MHVCQSSQICVIYGVKDSKILCWLYSVMLLSWVSVRGGWLGSLVLDNCTLPRSVVPCSVSLWPRLLEPYLGCTSASSYLSHPHLIRHTPIRQKGADKGTTNGPKSRLYVPLEAVLCCMTCNKLSAVFSVVLKVFVLDVLESYTVT